MNIKLKLSLQFTLIVTGILLFFSLLVYYFSYTSQLSKFRQNLLDSAKNTATLFTDVAEVDSTLLKKIQQSTISREREELALTDSTFKLIYGNNIHYLIDSARSANYVKSYVRFFSIKEKDGVFYNHNYENKHYYVYAMAYDRSRLENLTELRKVLLWSILFSTSLSILLSYLFARRAIKPVMQIIRSVKEINSQKLSNRLPVGNKRDELAQLSMTFNQMLSDLEIAFKNQEDFVSNASHELRTPLTVMIGESDYVLSHKREDHDYLKYISDTNTDLKKLNELLNNLLELAQIGRNTTIPLSKVRIDEVIYNSITRVKAKYPGRKIIPKILYPESENDLIVNGNEGLLTIAFQNLLDNACKFSGDDIIVEFLITDNFIKINISDTGIGIPTNELENIYRPFSRASNVKFIGGFGIGLSLVNKIMELHQAAIDIKSKVNEGTMIEVLFRREQA
jgi:signal transduction histidine kinase